MYQVLCGDVRKPMVSGWERDVPDPILREDIAAATDGDPQQRIASAAELATRIRRLEERRCAREAQAHLVSRSQRARPLLSRRGWIAVALIVALVAGLATGLVKFAPSTAAAPAQPTR
jgi:hypothetical protein